MTSKAPHWGYIYFGPEKALATLFSERPRQYPNFSVFPVCYRPLRSTIGHMYRWPRPRLRMKIYRRSGYGAGGRGNLLKLDLWHIRHWAWRLVLKNRRFFGPLVLGRGDRLQFRTPSLSTRLSEASDWFRAYYYRSSFESEVSIFEPVLLTAKIVPQAAESRVYKVSVPLNRDAISRASYEPTVRDQPIYAGTISDRWT